MIKIENVETCGWEAAIRGMRNPMNSWDKSDSAWCHGDVHYCDNCPHFGLSEYGQGGWCEVDEEAFVIGENDLALMESLSHAGNDHGKFLRMITVTLDITAPLYWFKEFDTYKVGTVANSCSTMHKIQAKEFTVDDFSHEHLYAVSFEALEKTIKHMNIARELFLETKDKGYWWQMIQLLPSSYNQKRTVQLNYAVLKSMYHARVNHKLDEWRDFCKWIEELPYFEELIR